MSTSTLYAALMATLVAALWLLGMGWIRMLAYRSGEIDHTPGMRNIAWLSLGLGAVFAVACAAIAVVIATR